MIDLKNQMNKHESISRAMRAPLLGAKAGFFAAALLSLNGCSDRETPGVVSDKDIVIMQALEDVRILSVEVEESSLEDACSVLESKINEILIEQRVKLRVQIIVEYGGEKRVDFRLRNNSAKTVLEVATDQAFVSYRIIDGEIVVRSYAEQ